tara:strand:- start:100 stop:498 length:399 start_codon:yes stop_codon:yes gene_type:complete
MKKMSNMYEEYNRENASYQRMWAEDAASSLPSKGDYCERFFKAYEEFRNVITEYQMENRESDDDAIDKLISLKKYAILQWEMSVALDVYQIEKHGSDRDKAKLKANKYWMRGTIRSMDVLYNNKKIEDEKNE